MGGGTKHHMSLSHVHPHSHSPPRRRCHGLVQKLKQARAIHERRARRFLVASIVLTGTSIASVSVMAASHIIFVSGVPLVTTVLMCSVVNGLAMALENVCACKQQAVVSKNLVLKTDRLMHHIQTVECTDSQILAIEDILYTPQPSLMVTQNAGRLAERAAAAAAASATRS